MGFSTCAWLVLPPGIFWGKTSLFLGKLLHCSVPIGLNAVPVRVIQVERNCIGHEHATPLQQGELLLEN